MSSVWLFVFRYQSSFIRVLSYHRSRSISGSNDAPSCDSFSPTSSKQGYCQPGQACLLYSWSSSVIRECVDTSVLLGPIENPLRVRPWCDITDISEGGTQSQACLCDSDLCNNGDSDGESFDTQEDTLPSLSDQNSIKTFISPTTQAPIRRNPVTPPPTQAPTQIITRDRKPVQTTSRYNNFEEETRVSVPDLPDSPGLQCFTCGSLLEPDKECDFNPSDPSQRKTCGPGEACLLYSWRSSAGDPAQHLRECFSTQVLLGSITSPLLPEPGCNVRDITEDGGGAIRACLCQTDNCNIGNGGLGNVTRPRSSLTRTTTSRPFIQRTTSPKQFIRQQQTTPRPFIKQQQTKLEPQFSGSCPSEFEAIPGGCIYVSDERVGWIEARKMCARRNSVLASMQTRDKRAAMLGAVFRQMRRRRDEFWLAGNDIEEEGVWEWAGRLARGSGVASGWGWSEAPYISHEENCLAWQVESEEDFWHSSSCCNNLRYICETSGDQPRSFVR